jgi:sec-independent protein translocase protein TatB
MLDIGWSELLVVAVVAVVVVGPKDLPRLMRTFGHYAGKLRRTAADFQRQFNEAMAESEAEEVRKNFESIRSGMGNAPDLRAPIDKPVMMPTPKPASIEPPPADAPKLKAKSRARKSAPRKAKPKQTAKAKQAVKAKMPAKRKASAAKNAAPKRRKTKAKAGLKR